MIRTLIVASLVATSLVAADRDRAVTYYQDVEPILRANCQGCHRPGEIGPMALRTYSEVRPWAEAIKEAVLLKRMPPWFADPAVGLHFKNNNSLSDGEINTLARWAETGAKEGDPSDAGQAPSQYSEGWNIPEPDQVFEMSRPFDVPSSGEVEYQYHVIPSGFTKDTWVQAAEVRPGNRSVVHHVIVYIRPPGSTYLDQAKPNEFYVPDKAREAAKENSVREMFVRYTPGYPAEVLEPGQARLVPAGSDFIFQLHYTPTGRPQEDLTKFGIVLAQHAPGRQVKTMAVIDRKFEIPAGVSNHPVNASLLIDRPLEVLSLKPHMHLRGKAFEIRLTRADGSKEVLLSVPHFDFNWQLNYELAEPLKLATGDKLEATGWYDNSPNNPANPDPSLAVRWGDQSREEMMIGFFEASFALDSASNDD